MGVDASRLTPYLKSAAYTLGTTFRLGQPPPCLPPPPYQKCWKCFPNRIFKSFVSYTFINTKKHESLRFRFILYRLLSTIHMGNFFDPRPFKVRKKIAYPLPPSWQKKLTPFTPDKGTPFSKIRLPSTSSEDTYPCMIDDCTSENTNGGWEEKQASNQCAYRASIERKG